MITIKRMQVCSIADITKAWNRGFEGYFIPVSMTEELLLQRLAAESYVPSLSVVAYDGDEPIGLVANGLRTIDGKTVAWNGGTGVASAYRRRGVGRRLMEASFELYREAGVEVATLEAISKNEQAIALYQQLGYEIVDRLLFWQRTDALSEDAFRVGQVASYQVKTVLPQETARLSFYRADVPWQNHWTSLRDAEALAVEDSAGSPVGYALYKRMWNEQGEVTAIVLRQCVAQPDHPDAETILRLALDRLYAPAELACRRSTFNLPASHSMLLRVLEDAGFGATETEQVLMVRNMEKAADR
ncbi:GNAT family N-acetyltransferase [Brevibacillus sp. TJ4]|uniref:GNAT family N-acetyltransferase n=1 Tax=Brevibacillus sp. TJ4 TaxID=3234853 RepID=UPI0037D3C883